MGDPSIQVSTVHQVTSSPPKGVPAVQVRPLTVRLSKVRTQQISGLSKVGGKATDDGNSPVNDDNSTLPRVSLATRKKIGLKPGLSVRSVSNLNKDGNDKVLENFSSRG